MPVLNTDIGGSNVKGVVQPQASLLYRLVDLTPGNIRIGTYTPFTDLDWKDSAASTSRVMASATVPLHLFSSPGRADTPDAEDYLLTDSMGDYEEYNRPSDRWYEYAERFLLPLAHDGETAEGGFSHTENDNTFQFRFYPTATQGVPKGELAMYKELGAYDSSGVTIVGVTLSEGGLMVHWNNAMFETTGRAYRAMVEEMGRWTPYSRVIGNGTLDNDGHNEDIGWRWNCGTAPYLVGQAPQRNIMAGDMYSPTDYMPYSAKRRAAPYHNLWHRAYSRVVGQIVEMGDNDGQAYLNVNASMVSAMSSLTLGQFAGFGQAGVVPNDPLDIDGTSEQFLQYMSLPVSATYDDFDIAAFVFGDELQYRATGDDVVHFSDDEADRLRDLFLMAYCLQAAVSKTQTLSTEMSFIYDGGPRPDQVADRLKMAYRPDVSTGSSNNPLGVTLIPSRIDGTAQHVRMPTLFSPNGSEHGAVISYRGIKDPVVYANTQTITYDNGRPNTSIEEDYAMFVPVVVREGQSMTQYRYRRQFNKLIIPRPRVHGAIPSPAGWMIQWFSDCAGIPAQGFACTMQHLRPVYSYSPLRSTNRLAAASERTMVALQRDDVNVLTVNPLPRGQDPQFEIDVQGYIEPEDELQPAMPKMVVQPAAADEVDAGSYFPNNVDGDMGPDEPEVPNIVLQPVPDLE